VPARGRAGPVFKKLKLTFILFKSII
jgi:hypothetical protein